MKYDPNKHHRRSIRLKGYDYTQPGAYFVTICTYQRDEIFGEVINGETKLSLLGRIAHEEWTRSAGMRQEIRLFEDELSILPNHLHGIIWIVGTEGSHPNLGGMPFIGSDVNLPNKQEIRGNKDVLGNKDARGNKDALGNKDARGASLRRVAGSLGSIIAGFKASVTSRAIRELNLSGIWQKNYFEHIIRNDRELNNIQWYIANNPLNWQLDRDNSHNSRKLAPPEKVEEYVKDVVDMVLKFKADHR